MEAKSALVLNHTALTAPNIPAQQSADSHDSRSVKHHRKHETLSRNHSENVSLSRVGETLNKLTGEKTMTRPSIIETTSRRLSAVEIFHKNARVTFQHVWLICHMQPVNLGCCSVSHVNREKGKTETTKTCNTSHTHKRKNKIGCQSVATDRHKPLSAAPRRLPHYDNCGWELICDWVWNSNLGQTSARLVPPDFLQTCEEHKDGLQPPSLSFWADSCSRLNDAGSGCGTFQQSEGRRDTCRWMLWCCSFSHMQLPGCQNTPRPPHQIIKKKETWSL